jgi:molybdenum cofactor guanylyltransferase
VSNPAGAVQAAPVRSLVLAGGASSRMGRDKALIEFHGLPQVRRIAALLEDLAPPACVSLRAAQAAQGSFAGLRHIVDLAEGIGPIAGILAAFAADPLSAWLVVAVDLPWLSAQTVRDLLAARDHRMHATAFTIPATRLAHPVCAIYEPRIRPLLEARAREQRFSLGVLNDLPVRLVTPDLPHELAGVDTPGELRAALAATPG